MGQEIENYNFTKEDFKTYEEKLKHETLLLKSWFEQKKFAKAVPNVGLEIEGWLINDEGEPTCKAQEFLAELKKNNVVHELALFNFEVNAPHYPLSSTLMDSFKTDLMEIWDACEEAAQKQNCSTIMIGSLPSLQNSELTMDSITPFSRYYALNQQIMAMRKNIPININISGDEQLKSEYDCILLESAATSLQIHLEVNQEDAVDFYNASILASPIMVALCANSAFLCGKSLWDETRVPVFEQTVIVGIDEAPLAKKRVTLGTAYLKDSLFELFQENLDLYPTLIPHVCNGEAEKMQHVNFHNGTVWRWNRPIIGFNDDGTPHLRIEHRVLPAGPTIQDTLANIVLFIGLVHALKDNVELMTKQVSFEDNYINLYEASKNGLESEFLWKNEQKKSFKDIFLEDLYPQIKKSLVTLGFTSDDIKNYLDDTIKQRVETGINGSKWQKLFVKTHGKDYKNLVLNYQHNQRSGLAVHKWPLDKQK